MKVGKPLLGTTAMAAASMLRVAIQLVTLPIIGRLLGPTAYGQIALVSPFVFFAMMLAESGLGTCIVRATLLTKELEGTILCFSAALSITIIAIFALLAQPIGMLVHDALFPYLLMCMSSILLLAAIAIVPTALLIRNKRYDYIAVSDLASSLGGITGVCIGLYLDWGVWSLVAQQIGFWLAKVAVVIVGAHWRPTFLFNRKTLFSQLPFGVRLTGTGIFSFVARNIDNILIGTFMGTETLGFYALAFQIVGLPSMITSGSVYFTVMSNTSESQREGLAPSADFFIKVLRSLLIVGLPAMVGLAITAPLSIPLILGDKWMPTANLIILLSPLGLQQIITAITVGYIIGLGRSDLILRLTIINSSLTIIAIIIGALMSSSAVAIGVSVTAIVTCYLHLSSIMNECHSPLTKIGRIMIAPVFSSTVMGLAVYGVQSFLSEELSALARLFIIVGVGASIYATTLLCLFHKHLSEEIKILKSAFTSQRTAD